MPISNFACWYQLINARGDYTWQLPCFTFYWLWAFKNRKFGPLYTDGGVLTFIPGIISGLLRYTVFTDQPLAPCSSVVTCARTGLETASNLTVAVNFSILISHLIDQNNYPWNGTAGPLFPGKNDLFVKVTLCTVFLPENTLSSCRSPRPRRKCNKKYLPCSQVISFYAFSSFAFYVAAAIVSIYRDGTFKGLCY